jgi:hypothetical protein
MQVMGHLQSFQNTAEVLKKRFALEALIENFTPGGTGRIRFFLVVN